jgi:carbon-monoxide dehydrogenase medium subunit
MDLPPILLTLDAKVSIAGTGGRRSIGIADLFTGYYQTSLEKNELITGVEVPALTPEVYTCYEKFTGRSADDWPTVGVAVWCRVNSNVISAARIAVSAATDRPMRMAAAESVLINAAPTPQSFSKAADAVADEVQPIADLHGSASYKREMVRVHVRRALEHAWQR